MIGGLEKEDQEAIDMMLSIVKKNIHNLKNPILLAPSKEIRIGEAGLKKQQQDGQKYFFYDENTLKEGLKEYFSDEYLIKTLAKNAYVYDEGDFFEEVVPVEKPLGQSKRGRKFVESNLLSIQFEVLPWGKLNKKTGLPFKIEKITLIPE